MMGMKIRSFSPLPRDVSLEELVPADHFYRRLEADLDLSFVRELVRPFYAGGGRTSADPVVFFKLQLVMFFEDLRSERQLMRVVAKRWIVEMTFGWLRRDRRLARDYERKVQTSETLIEVAMIRLILKRLARAA